MRTILIAVLAANVGALTWLVVQYAMKRKLIAEAHAEALLHNAAWDRIQRWRQAEAANRARFMKDLGIKPAAPRVEPVIFQTPFGSKCGYTVRAQNDAARVEVIIASEVFRPRSAA